MNKAYLVTFEVCTRVTADVPEGFDPNVLVTTESRAAFDVIVEQARHQIAVCAEEYLDGDNVTECVEDVECPYGTFVNEENYKNVEYKGNLITIYNDGHVVAWGEDELYDVYTFETDSLEKAQKWLDDNGYSKENL